MDRGREDELIGEAWAALSGRPRPVPVEVAGPGGNLPSRFPVEELAVASVGVALTAAAGLARRDGRDVRRVVLDRSHVAAAVRSERWFGRPGERVGSGFAPLSRFWAAADGWVRTHANYPWHRAALLDTLGLAPGSGADVVGAEVARWRAEELEAAVFAAGGVAAAVRSPAAWRESAQGRAVGAEALVSHRLAGDAPPRSRPGRDLPAAGVRVLDLTRVIAGPVCTRYLGALGADVLRIDPPRRPDLDPGAPGDTLLAKRSAVLDLAGRGHRLDALLQAADVVVCGYRPGALDRFGLAEDDLCGRRPGIVAVYLDAWGHAGPWAGRRGFDSIVQAACGIAALESSDGTPGALPCQLLDHATGYLAAAAVLDGLTRQAELGGTHVRRLSLARTAAWLMAAAAGPPDPPPAADAGDPARWLVELDAPGGPVHAVAPPGGLDDRPLRWPGRATGYGDDTPVWLPAD